MRKNLLALEWLRKKKVPFGSPALAVALESGDMKVVRFVASVLQEEKKMTLKELLHNSLCDAAKSGNLELVKWVER